MRVSVGRHSAGGDLPACPRAGSGGGEIRCASSGLYVIDGLSFIDGSLRKRESGREGIRERGGGGEKESARKKKSNYGLSVLFQ